jgi:hypothetical protein
MPAPTQITDSQLSGLIKNVYAQFREKVQNTTTPLVAQLNKAKAGGPRNMRWGGNGVYWDVVLGRPAGGNWSSSGYFGVDTSAVEKQATSGVARGYVRRQVDGLALMGTMSKEAAFQTLARKTMEELREASALLLEGAFNGAGNGVLAIVGTVTDTVTIIVSSPYGVTSAGQGSLLISVGDYIAVLTSDGVTVRGRAQVSGIPTVSGANSTLALATAIAGMVAADLVVKASASDTSYNSAPNGLINITNRGGSYASLHGITSASYGIWDAVRMVAGTDTPDAAQPTEDDIWDLLARIRGRSGKSAFLRPQEWLLMGTPGMSKKLSQSLLGQRRFTATETTKVIKGGYTAVMICGLPFVESEYCPAGTIYAIHLPSLAMVDAKDWGFVEYEGAGPVRWMDGRDAFEMTYGCYLNLATLARNAHGSITGYTDTVFYTHVVEQAS